MSITAYQSTRAGDMVLVKVTSSLSATPVFYYWFLDGAHVALSTTPEHVFHVAPGEQADIDCVDSARGDLDPASLAPAAYPARRTLAWVRSLDTDVDHYRVEQDADGAGYALVARVQHSARTWAYTHLTDRLDDLTVYTWRIIPVDAAGNQGDALTIGPETLVRIPDAPDFTVSYDGGTGRITVTEAA